MFPSWRMAQRSLQATSRSPAHFYLRLALVGGMLVALLLAAAWSSQLGAAGRTLFVYLAYMNVGFLSLVAIGWYAPILTEEKEAETLGLLRLAGFRMASILIGKSVGAFMATALLLLIQVPFSVLAASLGGITSHQVQAGYVGLGAFAVLAYGVGLLMSVLANRTTSAARLTAWVLGGILLLPWLGGWLLGMLVKSGTLSAGDAIHGAFERLVYWTAALSPLSVLDRVAETNWAGDLVPTGSLTMIVTGVVLVAIACIIASLIRAEDGYRTRLGELSLGGRPPERPGMRSRALVWKDRHFFAGGWRGLIGRCVIYFGVLILCALISIDRTSGAASTTGWGWTALWAMAIGIVVEAGIQSSRVFRVEVDDQTLFGLCLLPTRIGTWAYFKGVGAIWACAAPAGGFLIAVALVVFGSNWLYGPGGGVGAFLGIAFATMYGIAVLLILIHTTMLLSLYLPRGAFPVTIGGFALLALVIEAEMRLSGGGFSALVLSLLPFYALPLTAFLQVRIGRKLRELAAN